MDIYNFFRIKRGQMDSEKIGYKFNTLESCFLVWKNTGISLYEKHELWRIICLEKPDMEVKASKANEYTESLYELIEKFVATDKFFINEFYREGDKAVYQYRFYCEGNNGKIIDFETDFLSFNEMKNALEKHFDLPITKIEYRKKYLDFEQKEITLSVKKDGTIMNVVFSGFSDAFLNRRFLVSKDKFFEGLSLAAPT